MEIEIKFNDYYIKNIAYVRAIMINKYIEKYENKKELKNKILEYLKDENL